MNNDCESDCVHDMQPTDDGNNVCVLCGLEMPHILDTSPEWRFYKENDTKQYNDPSRCFIRKYEEKSIYRDMEKYKIPEKIIEIANNNYTLITEDSILRGNSRKGLIVACIYYAYEEIGERKSQDEIKNLFSINKKILSSGMKMFNLKMINTKRVAIYSSPTDFIPKILEKFELYEYHPQINSLFEKISCHSSFINRSNPDSIAAGLSFYFIKNILSQSISLNDFSKKVGLSDITIHKISKKIKDLIEEFKIAI